MVKSLNLKFVLIIGCFIFLILGGVIATFLLVDSQKNDGVVINLAGRQRMLTQKMGKEALGVHKGDNVETYRTRLKQTASLFDKTLKALMNGGETTGIQGESVSLSAASDPQIRAQLVEVSATWDKLNRAVQVILKSDQEAQEFAAAVESVEKLSLLILKEMNRAVGMYEAASSQKTQTLKTLLLTFLFLGVAFSLGALFVIRKSVVEPIKNVTQLAQRVAQGDLSAQQLKIRTKDEIRQLAQAFTDMTSALRDKATVAQQLAKGDLSVQLKVVSEHDTLGQAMVTMKESLDSMHADLQQTIEAQQVGDLDARCHPDRLQGAYADLLTGINETLDAVIQPIYQVSEIQQAYAKGDLEPEMDALPGKQVILTDGLNAIRRNLKALIDEGLTVARAAANGDLKARGADSKFEGGYAQIIQGMNQTIESLIQPINEAVSVLQDMSEGTLTGGMDGDYKGDYGTMKHAMNGTLAALNEVLGQVSVTVQQVATAAQQVADSSRQLSDGATKQASSLQQITASMNEIGAQTKQNAENANQANQLSEATRENADEGNKQMKKMLSAMGDIKKSSDKIYKIIKTIDEIAFQTNLLALNAAVEAARAGVHGKGFAVVAEEVRNLAQRSAKAAQETTELIEDSVMKVENGIQLANNTAKSLEEIVNRIAKATDIVGEIACASTEQAQGIEQVNTGLIQIDQVTQANTANAEESSSASEELSSQASQLKQLLAQFKLRNAARPSVTRESSPMPVKVVAKNDALGNDAGWRDPVPLDSPRQNSAGGSSDFIVLDDDEFGKF